MFSSAIPDHVPSFRDSVFINVEEKFENNGKPLDEADGGKGESELGQMTEISNTKSTDDEDSPEDTVSYDSLDDVRPRGNYIGFWIWGFNTIFNNTLKPVLRGHIWGKEKVVF